MKKSSLLRIGVFCLVVQSAGNPLCGGDPASGRVGGSAGLGSMYNGSGLGGAFSGWGLGGAYGPYRSGYSRDYGGGLGYGGFYGGRLFYGDYITGGGYPGYFAPFSYPNAPSAYATEPATSYLAPSFYYHPSVAPRTSYYFAPLAAPYSPNGPDRASARPAMVRVILPDPSATVFFDGHKTTSTGTKRLYCSPDLTPGMSYSYRLRATWVQDGQQVTQERTVMATPGQTTDVVFARVQNNSIPGSSIPN